MRLNQTSASEPAVAHYWDALNQLTPDVDGISFKDYMRMDLISRSMFNQMFERKVRESDELAKIK